MGGAQGEENGCAGCEVDSNGGIASERGGVVADGVVERRSVAHDDEWR